jgi:PilZ domain
VSEREGLRRKATEEQFSRSRRFPRFRYDARIEAVVFRDGENVGLWGRSSELAIDGVGATLSGEVSVGEVATIQFPIPLPPHVMKLRAIVRYNQGLRCGLEFLVVTREQQETMRLVFETLANISETP